MPHQVHRAVPAILLLLLLAPSAAALPAVEVRVGDVTVSLGTASAGEALARAPRSSASGPPDAPVPAGADATGEEAPRPAATQGWDAARTLLLALGVGAVLGLGVMLGAAAGARAARASRLVRP